VNAGRKAGIPNKVTRAMREDWLEAYEKRGGVQLLMGLDDETFAKSRFVRGRRQSGPRGRRDRRDRGSLSERIDCHAERAPAD